MTENSREFMSERKLGGVYVEDLRNPAPSGYIEAEMARGLGKAIVEKVGTEKRTFFNPDTGSFDPNKLVHETKVYVFTPEELEQLVKLIRQETK